MLKVLDKPAASKPTAPRPPERRPVLIFINDYGALSAHDRWNATSAEAYVSAEEVERLIAAGTQPRDLQTNLHTGEGLSAAVALANARQYTFHDGKIMDSLDLINHLSFGPDWSRGTRPRHRWVPSQVNLSSANVAFLATFLGQRGFDLRVIENYQLDRADLNAYLENEDDVLAVLISTTHVHNFQMLGDIARDVKNRRAGVPVIAGGILLRHFHDLLEKGADAHESWINYHEAESPKEHIEESLRYVDYLISEQRGETSLLALLTALRDRTDVHQVPNLSIVNNRGNIEFTFVEREPHELCLQEPILWNQLPYTPQKVVCTVTSRGCPYRCRFCVLYDSYPKMLFKPIEVFAEEVKSLRSCRDVSFAWLLDIEAFVGRKRTNQLLDVLIRHNPGILWGIATRADTITEEAAAKMKDAGVALVYMGLESGDQGQLDRMDKRMTIEDSYRALEILNKYGIGVSTSWVVGYPGETEETLRNTISMIEQSQALYHLSVLHYHPGLSKLAEVRQDFDIEYLGSPVQWKHPTMTSAQAAQAVFDIRSQVKHAVNEGSDSLFVMSYLLASGLSVGECYDLFRTHNQLDAVNRGLGSGNRDALLQRATGFARRVTWGGGPRDWATPAPTVTAA